MVAGVAAGIAAVFRTPLGAALLAVEVLYRDDFESDALIPAVLASVTAYSVVISIFGESTLFSHPNRFPFILGHLWLYGLLALLIAVVANVFLAALRGVQSVSQRLELPEWAKPGLGGLAMGLFCVPIIIFLGWRVHQPGQGLGLFGGGYGAVQIAISGSPWLPVGWAGAGLLLLLCLAKICASSLTIGSGGSAGDFAPVLAIGGLFGGAFGRAAQLLSGDPRIDAGAFALVGMGTLYGGIAHTPLSALVLVCELAGSYDLLVPLMLAEGIAFVALRKRTLYHAQVPTQRDSPVHQVGDVPDLLRSAQVGEVMRPLARAERARRRRRRRASQRATAHDAATRSIRRGRRSRRCRRSRSAPTTTCARRRKRCWRTSCAGSRSSTPRGGWSGTSTRPTSRGGTWRRRRRARRRRARRKACSPRPCSATGEGDVSRLVRPSPPVLGRQGVGRALPRAKARARAIARRRLLLLLVPELGHHDLALLLGHLGVLLELHGELALALGRRAQVGRVAEHVVQRHLGHRLDEAFQLLRRDDACRAAG